MKRTQLYAVGVPFILALTLSVATAGCHPHRDGMKPERVQRHLTDHVDDFIDDIDADASQATRIRAVRDRLLPRIPSLMTHHRQFKQDMKAQWAKEQMDAAFIHEQIDRRLKDASSFLHLLADGAVEIHQALSVEQRKEIAEHWD